MHHEHSSDLTRGAALPSRVAVPAAVLVLATLILTFVVSAVHGAPDKLPGVALESPLMLHAVRAFIVAGLIGDTAVAVLRLWRGELPTKMSTTAVEWTTAPDAAPVRAVQDQLLRVERESKAAIDELAALVRPLLPEPRDSVPVNSALERWEDALSDAEAKDALADAISALPEREKLVIALYFYENLTNREIGEILGVSRSTVHRYRARALERLQERLGRDPFSEDE